MARSSARSVPLVLGCLALCLIVLATATAGGAAAATTSCGSALPPKSTGESWQCTFSDDFTGTGINPRNWLAQRTDRSGSTSGGQDCFVDGKNNVAVSNGTLKLTSRKERTPFTCRSPNGNFTTSYTSGMVSTWNRFAQAYGRFEIRARTWSATVPGLQSAFWLWPQDSSVYGGPPASGEIDIAEMYSRYADRAIPYIHYLAAAPDPNITNNNCLITDLAAFHTYAVEWTPSSITVIYDGQTCLVDQWNPSLPLIAPQPFDQPFIIALTQGLGVGTNSFDPATTPLPATTEVDYVRVWR
jgi:beta-glucanase (GH16 family)